MNTNEIDKLKAALTMGTVLWYPDKDTAREVLGIGEAEVPAEDGLQVEPEPEQVDGGGDASGREPAAGDADVGGVERSCTAAVMTLCAHLTRGDYLALRHCDLGDFVGTRAIG